MLVSGTIDPNPYADKRPVDQTNSSHIVCMNLCLNQHSSVPLLSRVRACIDSLTPS